MRSPCHKTRIRAFIDADAVPERSRRAAITICEHCPIRRQCARDALTGGTSLDGNMTAPATGVIQAGIHCRGDQGTAQALAEIAGVRVPTYRKKRKRNHAPSNCVACGADMVPWTRGEVPEGKVMAYARGHCVHCRSAYNAMKAREGDQEPVKLRKPAPPRGRQRTPSHCRDCQRPMIPSSHPPREGYVKHHAGSRCATCYKRSRKAEGKARDAA